jgi:hypothetical protein
MRPPTEDPTAGLRARAIRTRPGAPQVIEDPTDPRCGELSAGRSRQAINEPPILDPTDPEYGEDAD